MADVFNLKILIIESHPDFAEIAIVEGVNAAPVQEHCAIFIGLMDEFHCVSTEPLTSSSSISQCDKISRMLSEDFVDEIILIPENWESS